MKTFEIEAIRETLDTALVDANTEEEAIEKYRRGEVTESDPHLHGEIVILNIRELDE